MVWFITHSNLFWCSFRRHFWTTYQIHKSFVGATTWRNMWVTGLLERKGKIESVRTWVSRVFKIDISTFPANLTVKKVNKHVNIVVKRDTGMLNNLCCESDAFLAPVKLIIMCHLKVMSARWLAAHPRIIREPFASLTGKRFKVLIKILKVALCAACGFLWICSQRQHSILSCPRLWAAAGSRSCGLMSFTAPDGAHHWKAMA